MINDSVSVIIRTKNEERWIGYAVQSVLTNLKKPEIIIIDNNSTDETLNIIGLFTQDKMLGDKKNRNYTNIKIFKIDDYTPGKALNLGVKNAASGIDQGALVTIDVQSGEVRALVGGVGNFFQNQFDRASNVHTLGSAFKPFVYLAALESGYKPNTKVLDAPLVIDQGPGLDEWKPKNYSGTFYGPSTLRVGLEKSRNLMTVRVAQDLGINKITEFSKKLNIYENPEEILSISLGSTETTLLKLTTAYCSFVNGGKLVSPILIDRIQDSEGTTIFNSEKRSCSNCNKISFLSDDMPVIKDNFNQIFSSETAYQITSLLEGAVKRGTGKRLRDLNLDIAGKTGTTNKNTDTWFIGFTSNLVVGVYVGFDNPKSLGKHETGARTALPIFKEFIKKTIKKGDARPFKVAKNIKMMVIDPSTGKKANFGSKKTIIEAYKKETIEKNFFDDKDSLSKRLTKKNILKFY